MHADRSEMHSSLGPAFDVVSSSGGGSVPGPVAVEKHGSRDAPPIRREQVAALCEKLKDVVPALKAPCERVLSEGAGSEGSYGRTGFFWSVSCRAGARRQRTCTRAEHGGSAQAAHSMSLVAEHGGSAQA